MTSRRVQLRIALRLRRVLAERARLDAAGSEAAAAWREARLRDLRRHALARSPLYRRLHVGKEDAPLAELPTTTKADLVDRFDELVTDPRLRAADVRALVAGDGRHLARRRYRVGATSGSSGRPGLVAFDEREWVGLLANAARARALAGPPGVPGTVRAAKIGSPSPWHLSRQVSSTLHDPRKPSLLLDASHDVAELARQLAAWRPHVLTGYPSVLAALADEALDGRLDIAPAQVFSGGERLTPAARRRIAQAWGVEPFDQYLTTEAGFVAIECPAHDGLHLLDDHAVVEVVDDAGASVPPGGTGARVLVTVLGSRTLPLIRYQLDDAVEVAEGPCACGRRSPRLRTVAGSARELLSFPAHAGGAVSLHPVVITAVLDPAPVRAWQVVQGPAGLRLRVAGPDAGFDAAAIAGELRGALARAGAAVGPVEVEVVDDLVRTAAGKAALVVRASMQA